MVFSEDSRVKIPCILHLVRLGYSYLSLKGASWDEQTNIFPTLFSSALARINPELEADDINRLLGSVRKVLTVRIDAMTGWSSTWPNVTKSQMQLGS